MSLGPAGTVADKCLPWSPVGAPVGAPVAGAPAGVPLADFNSKESSWRTSIVKNPLGGPE